MSICQLRIRNPNLRSAILVLIGGMATGLFMFAVAPPHPYLYINSSRRGIAEIIDMIEDDIPDDVLSSHDAHEAHHEGEAVIAEHLKKKVKVLCWVMTRPETHDKKAKHVKATWGKRCNKLIFMSSQNDTELGAIDLKVGDGRQLLWGKTRAAFKYVYNHHINDYDWFFKGDDDTYVIMENMRYMLSAYDPSYPIYFGSRFKKFCKQGYMSGGGGYVLSREAVKQFVEKAMPNKTACRVDPGGAEDAEMGKCLNNIGTLAGDSRDSLGRGRFFPFVAETHLMGGVPQWYLDYVYYKPDTGLNCCSDTPVTFHYVSTGRMYELEYLLYHARPYGIVHPDPFPAPLPPDHNSVPKNILEKQKTLKSKDTEAKQDVQITDQKDLKPKETVDKEVVQKQKENVKADMKAYKILHPNKL